MLVAILIILCIVLWSGIVVAYFRDEIYAWYDNKFGPDLTRPKKADTGKKPFWRFYG